MALNPKYKKADLEGRLATFTLTNDHRIPIVLQVMLSSGIRTREGVRELTEDELYAELHMVTRRSIANPGEKFMFHIELRTPIDQLPPGTYYALSIGASNSDRGLINARCILTEE